MKFRGWILLVGVVVAGSATASGLKLKATPITMSAAGYAIPEVSSVANGQSTPLKSEGPAAEPNDWTFKPSHTVTAAGSDGDVKGVATFFSGPNFEPSFPNMLLPNAGSGKTTVMLTSHGHGNLVKVPVTVTAAPNPDIRRGKKLYADNCAMCHGVNAQGQGDFPNLTYTDAGIGGWGVWQFNRAVRVGVDDAGGTLAQTMPRWQLTGFKGDAGHPPTAQEISDIFGYLKTLK